MSTCVCCGAAIPDGRHVCSNCETWSMAPDAILADGTKVYFKPTSKHGDYSLQLALYEMLTNYKRAIQKD